MTSTSTYVGDAVVDQTTCDLEFIEPTSFKAEPAIEPKLDNKSEIKSETRSDSETMLEVETLCPFCGSFNSGIGKPCGNCRQEDTIATRAATTRRQGPWYVLREGNLDSAGMNFDELLNLVRKQTLTARSVVRGATTGQLWRMASRVRGLSREFGQCYSCAGDIESDEAVCPHCDRVQTVLEHADVIPQQATASRPIPTVAQSVRPTFDPGLAKAMMAAPVIHVHSLSHPEHEPVDPAIASRPVVAEANERHVPKDDLLTPRDVAKAFQLEFGPDQLERLLSQPTFTARKMKIALTSSAALLIAALLLWPLTHIVSEWIDSSPATGNASVASAATPTVSPVASGDARQPADAAFAPADHADYTSASGLPVATPPVTGSPVSSPYISSTPAAATPAANMMVTPVMMPEPVPAVSPQDDPKLLWTSALDAESTGNYAAAVQSYERIESLPSDSWPANLETRLALARKELKGDTR